MTNSARTKTAPAWDWPDSLDALTAAPKHHRLLLENDSVRVLEVRIPPGEMVPVHTHRWPSVAHSVRTGDFVRRDGEGNVLFESRTAAGRAPKTGGVEWLGPLGPHSVENVGSGEIVLFTVELKPGA